VDSLDNSNLLEANLLFVSLSLLEIKFSAIIHLILSIYLLLLAIFFPFVSCSKSLFDEDYLEREDCCSLCDSPSRAIS